MKPLTYKLIVGTSILCISLVLLSSCGKEATSSDIENDKNSTATEEEDNNVTNKEESDHDNETEDNDESVESIPEFETMTFEVVKNEEDNVGTFEVQLRKPNEEYILEDGVVVEMTQYFPDFYLDDGEPESESNYPFNPAFVFKIHDQEHEEIIFIAIGKNVKPNEDAIYDIQIVDYTYKERKKF